MSPLRTRATVHLDRLPCEVITMRRTIGRWRALANAGFVLAVLALAGFGMDQVASRQWRVQPTFHVRAEFATIGGLEVGTGSGSRGSTPG